MLQEPEDTLTLLQEPDTGAVQTVYRKPTVAEVIRWLGPGATPEQQDSAVQAHFEPQVFTPPSQQPDTLHLPGLPANPFHADLTQTGYGESFFKGNAFLHPEIPFRMPGIAADPLPYRMRSDDYVNTALLLAFFLAVLVIARSKHFLRQRIKDFFHSPASSGAGQNAASPEQRGWLFLVFQTCFALSILFFNYTQNFQTEVFNRISPYILIGLDVGICVAYYALKTFLYAVVNGTFFKKNKNREWNETYMLVTLGEGVLLLPLALLVVYFNLPFEALRAAFFLVIVLFKLLLLYKCYRIFFNKKSACLHLILYFCTLEITPMLILWRTLVYGNECLVVNI